LRQLNLNSLFFLVFAPEGAEGQAWQLIYFLLLSVLLVFLSWVVFKRMAIKNNLILAASSEGSGEIALSIRGLKRPIRKASSTEKAKKH